MYQLVTTIFLSLGTFFVLNETFRLYKIIRRQQMQIDILYSLQDQLMRHLSEIEERLPHDKGNVS